MTVQPDDFVRVLLSQWLERRQIGDSLSDEPLAGRLYTGRQHVISGGFGSTSLPVALTEAWHQASTPHPCSRFPTAYSLTALGLASMTVEATASASDAAGLISPATRWAAVMPPLAASTPVA